jgi:hypothetical protein
MFIVNDPSKHTFISNGKRRKKRSSVSGRKHRLNYGDELTSNVEPLDILEMDYSEPRKKVRANIDDDEDLDDDELDDFVRVPVGVTPRRVAPAGFPLPCYTGRACKRFCKPSE